MVVFRTSYRLNLQSEMKKIILQGALSLLFFSGLWLIFSRVNWVSFFRIEKATDDLNDRVGRLIYESIDATEVINKDPAITKTLDSILFTICLKNDMDTTGLRIHLIRKDMVNAFATPGKHIFVFSGLINETEKQEELIGVIAHELAHIKQDHVMKKLVTEVGLSALVTMTSGTGGAAVSKELVQLLSSSAYSRKLETEADFKGADYMLQAGVNPGGLADFLYKMASQNENPYNMYWLHSHPESKERAQKLTEYVKGRLAKPLPLISDSSWREIKAEVQKLNEND